MRLLTEWLITIIGGIVGGGIGLLTGAGLWALAASAAPFHPALAVISTSTLFLGAFGAMLGGHVVGRYLDRKKDAGSQSDDDTK